MKLSAFIGVLRSVEVEVFRAGKDYMPVYLLQGNSDGLDLSGYADCVVSFCCDHFGKLAICIEV